MSKAHTKCFCFTGIYQFIFVAAQVLVYGRQTGSKCSCLTGLSLIAAGRIGTDFSFRFRSVRGSGDCLRMERVKLPCVTVTGPPSPSPSLGRGGAC